MKSRNGNRAYARLTQPLVRENGALRPATWDEALDRAAEGFRRNLAARGPELARHLQLLEVHQRGELPGAEAGAGRVRHEQHRQLQPDLTRAQRRRSGDGLRCGRRDELLPRGGGDGRRLPLGLERARGAPHLVPPPAQGGAARGAALRHGPAAHDLGAVGGRVAGPPRGQRHRALERDGARDHPRRAPPPARSSRNATEGFEAYRAVGRALHARGGRAHDRRARPT